MDSGSVNTFLSVSTSDGSRKSFQNASEFRITIVEIVGFSNGNTIRKFQDICKEKGLVNRIIYKVMGNRYDLAQKNMKDILQELETCYSGQKKGIFVSNDTHANILLNLLIGKYGTLPDDYLIVGFDDSPIATEAVIPISTVGQQIDKIAYETVNLLVEQMNERKKRKPVPLKEPVHRMVTPVLKRRETTERQRPQSDQPL